MNHDRQAMQALVDRLLGARGDPLSAEELDAALSWLAGRLRHGGEALSELLGTATEHRHRRVMVYDQLDIQLFRDGQLRLPGAHLDIDVDDETRRARYRRLMTAFHPDRYPDHTDWLTSRSQAVHASYARFRKGRAPEHREAATRERSATGPANPARAPRPSWRRDRRSARLTPAAGPGPLTRVRTWLLGIENLQQRIFVGLAVVCLVPVLYAYFAYKPYRAIEIPDTPVTDSETERAESVDMATTSNPGDPPAGSPADSRVDALAEAVMREQAADDRRAAIARTRAVSFPPIESIDYRSTGPEAEPEANPEPGPDLAPEPWPDTAPQTAPDPKGTWAAIAERIEPLVEATGELLEGDDAPHEASVASADERGAGPGTAAGSDPEPREPEPADESADTAVASSDAVTVINEAAPRAGAAGDASPGPQPEPEPDPGSIDTERSVAAITDGGETPSPSGEPSEEAVESPTPDATTLPDPKSGSFDDPGSGTGSPAGGDRPGRDDPAPAGSPDAAGRPSRSERAVAEADATEPEPAAPASDVPDPVSRRHIEELLAGYRRSFENGWLEDFLDHFTESPRENRHQGRGWFRNNYGWLFENSEQRRLWIDIIDIARADDHWLAETRFEMRVDYPDRPSMHSDRRVRYRIELNEHDQFRIAAIEY